MPEAPSLNENTETRRGIIASLSLAQKFVFFFTLASVLIAGLSFVMLDRILSPTFEAIEQAATERQVARAQFALEQSNTQLLEKSRDYANWDDSYRFVRDNNETYRADTFSTATLVNLGVDYMGVIRFDGTVRAGYALDDARERYDFSKAASVNDVVIEPKMLDAFARRKTTSTYIASEGNIYAIQASHILRSDESGEPLGVFVMALRLQPADLSETLQVEARLNSDPEPAIRDGLKASQNGTLSIVDRHQISNELALLDVEGNLIATVEFDSPRDISAVGDRTVRSAMVAMALSLALLAILQTFGVNRLAVSRLRSLQGYVARFSKQRAPITSRLLATGDEIGALARQFDRLGSELQEAEDELRQQSYVQGKADSAVGMLHNIRNALGPLQVKHDKWYREDTQAFRGELVRALDELDTQSGDSERREKLDVFVKRAMRKIVSDGETRADELADIKGSIDQIVEILSDYDFDTSKTISTEALDLGDIIKREVANRAEVENVPIELNFNSEMPPVMANRITLIQLVDNIIGNAVDSMREQGAEPMQLSVAVARRSDHRVAFGLTDNGAGAGPDELAKAFKRGFSTRQNKTGGAGLHWSANAANAMDGRLTLTSEGRGKGATIWLELPMAQNAQADGNALVTA